MQKKLKPPSSEPFVYSQWTVGQVLRRLSSYGKLRKMFLEDSYLDSVTIGELAQSPLAFFDFLTICQTRPQCGSKTVKFVRNAIEMVIQGDLDLESVTDLEALDLICYQGTSGAAPRPEHKHFFDLNAKDEVRNSYNNKSFQSPIDPSMGDVAVIEKSPLSQEGPNYFNFKNIPTLAEFSAKHYLPHVKSQKRSWVSEESMLRNHILPVLGKQRLSQIRRSDIIELHNGMRQAGYAAATANRTLALLSFMLNCAMRWKLMPKVQNPASGIKPLPDNGAKQRCLTQQEAQRLMAELETNPNRQACNIVKLLLFTGARKTEIMHARWEFVDFERRCLTVPSSAKSREGRYIMLSDAALVVLRFLPRDPEIPWLFWNPKTGRPQDSIHHGWDTIRKRAGIPDVRLHDLRHSFARFLVNSGRSLHEVQKLLGHSNAKSTQRYAHLEPGALIEAANIIGDLVQTESWA